MHGELIIGSTETEKQHCPSVQSASLRNPPSLYSCQPPGLATKPRVWTILPHEKVDLPGHFVSVNSAAGLICLSIPLAAGFLIISAALGLIDNPIHG